MLSNILLLSCIIIPTHSFNILVYSPAFAGSHTNYMARLADTLTEAGHNVTFFVPVIEEMKKDQLGVKITKNVIVVEPDEETRAKSVPFDNNTDVNWASIMDSSNARTMFSWFCDSMDIGCASLARRRDVFDQLRSIHFDVAILEPISACGMGYVKNLGIDKVILASSCINYDVIIPNIGEEEEHSYVPSMFSMTSDKMTMLERYENYKVGYETRIALEYMFDREMSHIYNYLGFDHTDWRQLAPAASLHFTNSIPYIDFPRSSLQKVITIGGISVDIDKIKWEKITEEWNEVMNRRRKNVLISFGSMIKSSKMPIEWRNGILEGIKQHPDVTFIWKYETDELEWAKGVDNIHFSKWVPQTALLVDKRMSAFITHGGLGSTNELAYLGVPSIMIPIFADQIRNANMLARHGGVIVINKMHMYNGNVIKEAIKDILIDDKYDKNAKHIAELLQDQPLKPKELVVKYTEFVAKYGPFPQMDPHGRQLNWFQKNYIDVYACFGVVGIVITSIGLYIIKRIISIVPFRITTKKTD